MKHTNKNKEIDNIVNKAFVDKIFADGVKHTIGIMCIINHLEEQEQYEYVQTLKGLLGVVTMTPTKHLLDMAWELHEIMSEKDSTNDYIDTECMSCEPDEETIKMCLNTLHGNKGDK